ncbi:MAG TPA: antibiotic biosynthesis monooxygenase family protein [Puia sp.]|uniref:putative quinol monooxygenase n=1 Tax=Puia sp. TaxID=2045100 RepID=UPI002B8D1EC1|nr:antibiotic biosynthesis monooxygenase family protein [Puia sp.]HVU94597.1 antibiotic biosynthesis monooxygenase family protein [Puia sp.]
MKSNKSFLQTASVLVGFLLLGTNARAQEGRVIQLAKLEIDSAKLETYKANLKEGIETALKLEPGVIMLYAVSEKDHPTSITILEIYADSAAYRAHLRTAHFLKYKSATAAMVKRLELVPAIPVMQDANITRLQKATGQPAK